MYFTLIVHVHFKYSVATWSGGCLLDSARVDAGMGCHPVPSDYLAVVLWDATSPSSGPGFPPIIYS